MKEPLVSILLITYCQEKYIAQALDSVLMQRCGFEYEIVIGEDASPDATLSVCESYRERYPERIRICPSQANSGLVRNYYRVFEACRGKYIVDLAGDDFWSDPERLQKQVDILEKYPQLSFVYGACENYLEAEAVYEKDRNYPQSFVFSPDDFGPKTAARWLRGEYRPVLVTSTACFRRSMLQKHYESKPELFLNPDYRAADVAVAAALLTEGPAYYMPDTMFVYRVLPESVSHSQDKAKWYDYAVRIFRQLIDWTVYLGVSSEMKDYCLAKYADYLHYAYLTRNKGMARDLHAAIAKAAYRPSLKHRLKYRAIVLWGK